MKKMLEEYVPDYDKHVDFKREYAEGYSEAVRRSRGLATIAKIVGKGHHEHNSVTGMYLLTEYIRVG